MPRPLTAIASLLESWDELPPLKRNVYFWMFFVLATPVAAVAVTRVLDCVDSWWRRRRTAALSAPHTEGAAAAKPERAATGASARPSSSSSADSAAAAASPATSASAAAAAAAAAAAPRSSPSPAELERTMRRDEALQQLRELFSINNADLNRLIDQFISEMREGLARPLGESTSEIKQIPSFVSRLPRGDERATVIALDLGGTNFRVVEMHLRGGGKVDAGASEQFKIPDSAMHGTADELFDFIASGVGEVVDAIRKRDGNTGDEQHKLALGFTFSFPVNQTAIDSGTLISWTKNFTTKGVVGEDVVKLLQSALTKRGLSVRVAALVNDTVGTLMASAYSDPKTRVGVIIGTGSNACYVEKVERIGKWQGERPASGLMIINMECGNFDSKKRAGLKHTKYDDEVDRTSKNPGAQALEKMVSGMYLGELARLLFSDLIRRELLLDARALARVAEPWSLDTRLLSDVAKDRVGDAVLANTKNVLENELGIRNTSISDRRVFHEICHLVGARAARLSAAFISAIIKHTGDVEDGCTVAIDGSVFEHYPRFAEMQRATITEALGIHASERINLVLSKDGSGKGAAIIAALADQ